MMMNDDERGRGIKNAENLMTSYVNDPLFKRLFAPVLRTV